MYLQPWLGKIEELKMKIKVKKTKLWIWLFLYGFFGAFVLILPILRCLKTGEFEYIYLFMWLVAIFCGFLFYQLIRIRKKYNEIMILKNGVLLDNSSPVNYGKTIKIENIKSIYESEVSWPLGLGRLSQLKIKMKNRDGLVDPRWFQLWSKTIKLLRGNKIYLTDFLVDKADFEKLKTEIKKTLPNTV